MAPADADYSDWVGKLDTMSDMPSSPAASVLSSGQHIPRDSHAQALDELEQEMKLLQWHKLANEAALKAALIRTKRLKAQGGGKRGRSRGGTKKDREMWMRQVIEEEQAKPLEVCVVGSSVLSSSLTSFIAATSLLRFANQSSIQLKNKYW